MRFISLFDYFLFMIKDHDQGNFKKERIQLWLRFPGVRVYDSRTNACDRQLRAPILICKKEPERTHWMWPRVLGTLKPASVTHFLGQGHIF